MFRHVYVRFENVGAKNGTPFSYEPRKWLRCLRDLGILPDPDGWERTSLDRRVRAVGVSEFRDSLNLGLWSDEGYFFEQDMRQLAHSFVGAVEVKPFDPIPSTPPLELIKQPSNSRNHLSLRMASITRPIVFPRRFAS